MTTPAAFLVGSSVRYIGERLEIHDSIGVILRPKRFNHFLEADAYPVQFPQGYFQIAETQLVVIESQRPPDVRNA